MTPERVFQLQTLELGESIAGEIERGVRSSGVTFVVLSSAYMDDRWAAFGEQLAAYASVAKDVHGLLLPLLLEGATSKQRPRPGGRGAAAMGASRAAIAAAVR